jgi:serine/threonine-protein kinase
MDAERWEKIRAAFDKLVDVEPEERAHRLAAFDDAEFRGAVETLLSADARATAPPAFQSAFAPPSREVDPYGFSGRTVSHFRVLEPLGAGGMGMVYRAEDIRLGRAVALKFLLPHYNLDASAKARFLHEARSAAALDHPNLCTIYEVGESEDGRLFFAMALYSGETLDARLARDNVLPVQTALEIGYQVAGGLTRAHDAGIVHRDLKPGNVMLLPDGTVKILDFGLAKARDLSLTGSGMQLGTLLYMAPEQIVGDPVDARTDLWALGVLLYEALTGTRPFAGDQSVSVAHAILHREPTRPSAIRADIPPALDTLILCLLAKGASRRYESALATSKALAAILLASAEPLGGAGSTTLGPIRNFTGRPRRLRILLGLLALAVGAAGVSFIASERGRSGPDQVPLERSIAVLPFDNLSAEAENEFLAGGLQEAVITQLTRIADLRVISRQSARTYAGTNKPVSEIGKELGVGVILQASVQTANDQIRVSAQFIDARRDGLLWANQYQRLRRDLFALQNEIARDIVEAVQARLTASERDRLTRSPTLNADAYTFYINGREYQQRAPGRTNVIFAQSEEDLRAAESLFRRALTLDPRFALAYAQLAHVHWAMHANRYDRTPARLEQMRVAMDSALSLEPALPEAHLVASNWYLSRGDEERAGAELEIARRGLPNDAPVQRLVAFSRVRRGRWRDAAVEYERALTLDPRQAVNAVNLAFIYQALGRYADAARVWDHAIAIAPDNYRYLAEKGRLFVRWTGTTDSLAAALARTPRGFDPGGATTTAWIDLARLRRRPSDALPAIAAMRPELLEGDDYLTTAGLRAQRADIYEALGDTGRAHADYHDAARILEQALESSGDDAHLHADLGMIYGALGRKEEAIREVRRAMELVPSSKAAREATIYTHHAALTYARVGEADAALELLEGLVTAPNWTGFSVQELRVDPVWDPLRSEPRFQRLVR